MAATEESVEQLDIFASAATNRRRRDEAIARVDRNAETPWKDLAYASGRQVAETHVEFIVDDVWTRMYEVDRELAESVHEPRAMGAVLMRLSRDGVIEPTERFMATARKSAHSNPRRIWRSRASIA